MKLFDELQHEIRALFPKAKIEPDKDETNKFSSWLNVTIGNRRFTFECKPGHPIGLSETTGGVEAGCGEEPDHVAETVGESLEQLMAIIEMSRAV